MDKKILKRIFALGCLSLALFAVVKTGEEQNKPKIMKQMVKAEEVEKMSESSEENNIDEIIIKQDKDDEIVEYEKEDVSICVIGRAKTKLTPDSANIYARIETLENDITLSKDNNFSVFDGVVASLKENGIAEDNIKLEYFNCQPSYDYSSGKTLMGYYSTTAFSFDVTNIDDIKMYIDLLTENGVTSVDNINFKVSNMEEQYRNTLSSAIENAREKAESMFGEGLNLVKLKEEYIYSSSNLMRSYNEGLSPIAHLGKVEIEAQVVAVFEK